MPGKSSLQLPSFVRKSYVLYPRWPQCSTPRSFERFPADQNTSKLLAALPSAQIQSPSFIISLRPIHVLALSTRAFLIKLILKTNKDDSLLLQNALHYILGVQSKKQCFEVIVISSCFAIILISESLPKITVNMQ